MIWFFLKDRCDSKLKYHLKVNAIKRAALRSNRIIVPFACTRDFLREELGIPEERFAIVRYGADHEQFFPLQTDEELARPTFLAPDKKNVLFVGAVNYGKGIDTLIKCFSQVVKAVPEACLVVGSKGWDTPLIKQAWADSPVKENIKFVGFIPEEQLRAAYIYADITCFPSRYGFGLPTLESMACGTPTVSGRTLDAPEFVEEAGLLADPESADELAMQLTRLLTDQALYTSIKEKGLAKAAAYRWELTARDTAAVYRQLVE